MQQSVEVDLELIDHSDRRLADLELATVNTAKQQDANTCYRRRSVPGIGKLWSRVRLDDIHDIRRFARGPAFVFYCRLVRCTKASAGKHSDTSGTKMGHAYLKWAFSEAAVLFVRDNPAGQNYLARV